MLKLKQIIITLLLCISVQTALAEPIPDREILEKAISQNSVKYYQEYLAKHPETPFKAEIYINMGSLLSNNQNDKKQALEYFAKAREILGDKFTYEHAVIWASLVNNSRAMVIDRIEYLQWLYHLQEAGTVEDMYPVEKIYMVLKGHPVTIPNERLAGNMSFFKQENARKFISTATTNILWKSTGKADLEALMKAFPDREIGIKARAKLGLPPLEKEKPEIVTAARKEKTVVSQVKVSQEEKKTTKPTTMFKLYIEIVIWIFVMIFIISFGRYALNRYVDS